MKKNGEIELLRFVFAMIIVIFHFEFNYKFGIFTQGRIGVEFFFSCNWGTNGKRC